MHVENNSPHDATVNCLFHFLHVENISIFYLPSLSTSYSKQLSGLAGCRSGSESKLSVFVYRVCLNIFADALIDIIV